MGVILRSPADGGTPKNLEILRGIYLELAERLRMTKSRFLRGAFPEPVEGLRMTWRSSRMETRLEAQG